MSDSVMQAVGRLDYEAFTSEFGNVIEHCPIVAAAAWCKKPFHDQKCIIDAFNSVIDSLPVEAKVGILRCHPDLAGKLADADQLTDESKMEQRAAGLDSLTAEEKLELRKMNTQYKEKFSFPFVICARQNKKEAILKGLKQRLENDEESEVRTGIEEVKKIGQLRIEQILPKLSSSL